VETLEAKSTLEVAAQPKTLCAAAVSSSGNALAIGMKNGAVELWDVRTSRRIAAFEGDPCAVRGMSFSPDEMRLAVARDASIFDDSRRSTGSVSVLDLETGQSVVLATNRAEIVRFSADGLKVAAPLKTKPPTICVWDMRTGIMEARLPLNWDTKALTFYLDAASLIVGHNSSPLHWQLGSGHLNAFSGKHARGLWCLELSPDGKTIATGGSDKAVRLWNVATGTELLAWRGLGQDVGSLLFSHDGTILAIGTGTPFARGPVRLLRAPSLETIARAEQAKAVEHQNSQDVENENRL
jgi:WD40 repeat protein